MLNFLYNFFNQILHVSKSLVRVFIPKMTLRKKINWETICQYLISVTTFNTALYPQLGDTKRCLIEIHSKLALDYGNKFSLWKVKPPTNYSSVSIHPSVIRVHYPNGKFLPFLSSRLGNCYQTWTGMWIR